MGLAGGKSKLKLIDIENRPCQSSTPEGGAPASSIRRDARNSGSMTASATRISGENAQTGCEIGAMLSQARESSGQDLRDVSRQLRIREAYLNALETGDFQTLPGMTYAIGYVRTYAQYLGLDPERAVSLFKSEAQELEGPRQLVFPSPAPEGKVPGGALMFMAAVLAVTTYAGWYYLTASGREVADYTPPLPSTLQSWLGDSQEQAPATDGFTSSAVASIPNQPQPAAVEAPKRITPATQSAVGVGSEQTSVSTPSDSMSGETAPVVAAIPIDDVDVPAEQPIVASPDETTETAPDQPAEDITPPASAPVIAVTSQPADRAPESQPAPSSPIETATTRADDATDAAQTTESAVTESTVAETEPTQSEPVQAASTEPSAEPVREPVVTAVLEDDTIGPDTEPAPQTIQTTTQTTTRAAIPPAPEMRSDSSASATTTQQATGGTPARVVIKATADSWVQVRAGDSSTLMTRVMRAGDVYNVPNRAGLRLYSGNAGALQILVDGEAVKSLGAVGDIARNVALDPAALKKQVN